MLKFRVGDHCLHDLSPYEVYLDPIAIVSICPDGNRYYDDELRPTTTLTDRNGEKWLVLDNFETVAQQILDARRAADEARKHQPQIVYQLPPDRYYPSPAHLTTPPTVFNTPPEPPGTLKVWCEQQPKSQLTTHGLADRISHD